MTVTTPKTKPNQCANHKCATTKTPLWRKAWKNPDGSTAYCCNACGLAWRKGNYCPFPWCYQIYKSSEMWADNETWITCDECEHWVHLRCVIAAERCAEKGIPLEAITADVARTIRVSDAELRARTKQSYTCPRCLPPVTTKASKSQRSTNTRTTALSPETSPRKQMLESSIQNLRSMTVHCKRSLTSIEVNGRLAAVVQSDEITVTTTKRSRAPPKDGSAEERVPKRTKISISDVVNSTEPTPLDMRPRALCVKEECYSPRVREPISALLALCKQERQHHHHQHQQQQPTHNGRYFTVQSLASASV